VAEDDLRGTVLQSIVDGHIITMDPQIISQFIGVPILDLPARPFNEVVLPPSMDEFQEFFHMAPQGEGHQTSIKIGALGPAHRMLAKIVQHNLWPPCSNLSSPCSWKCGPLARGWSRPIWTFRSASKSIIQIVVMMRLLHQRLDVGLPELHLWQRMFDSLVFLC
jgi:hypothetical protein